MSTDVAVPAAHDLTLTRGGHGVCDCGETFVADGIGAAVRAWEAHVETLTLLHEVRMHARAEREARVAAEATIRRLVDLGVAGRKIAEEIGQDDQGRYLYSPTVVQRLGREHHGQSPRRRRRG